MSEYSMPGIFQDQMVDAEFGQEGYCILSHSSLLECTALARLAFNKRARAYKAADFRSTFQIQDSTHRSQVHSTLVEIFARLISSVMIDCKIIWAGYAVKYPSGARSMVELHQDISMCDMQNGRPPVTAWVPLLDTGFAEGGMCVVPKKVFFSSKPRAHSQKLDWEDRTRQELQSSAAPLHVQLGHALFFHQALLHYSAPNYGSNVRVAVMLVILPQEKRAAVYRIGKQNGEFVPDDYYVTGQLRTP